MFTKSLSTAQRVQPSFVEPMYAEAVRELPNGDAWTFEAKLDGYRCLAMRRNGHAVLWSRRGTLFSLRFPEIARACEKLPPDTLIDGEVVAIDARVARPSTLCSTAALTRTFSSTRSTCSCIGVAT
jgi:ATP-dependent DNA ligase